MASENPVALTKEGEEFYDNAYRLHALGAPVRVTVDFKRDTGEGGHVYGDVASITNDEVHIKWFGSRLDGTTIPHEAVMGGEIIVDPSGT